MVKRSITEALYRIVPSSLCNQRRQKDEVTENEKGLSVTLKCIRTCGEFIRGLTKQKAAYISKVTIS